VRFYHRPADTGILMSPFRDAAAYRSRIPKEFNIVTAENVMKMNSTHPSRLGYNFTDGDELVEFAEENEVLVRGHVLVWHSQVPAWLTEGTFSKVEVQAIMADHIATVAGHYQGRIFAWDVVNEAIDDATGKLRDTIWRESGRDYIQRAFHAARAADPDAVLCYNDYNHAASLSWQQAKSDAV
jgi:endo-1,4-beta-xylanase